MDSVVNSNIIIDRRSKGKIVRKNMILLLAGQLVSLFGSSIYSFAISLYILEVTGSGLNFALTMALGSLPRVILGPISGVAADRFDRKKMVVVLDILSGVVVLALLGLSLIDSLRLTYIYATTFLLSACNTFFHTPLVASIPNLVDDENLTRVNSLSQAISSISAIAGPFVGGMVFAIIDIRLFLLINGLSFVLSGISETFIDFEARKKIYGKKTSNGAEESDAKAKKTFFSDMKEGAKYIASQKWLVILGSFVVFFNMFTMIGLTVPVPYIVREMWGFSSKQYGLMNMMFPVGGLLGSIALSLLPQAKSNYRRLIICILIFSAAILFVGILTSEMLFTLSNLHYLIILMVLYMVIAIASLFINIPLMVTMQKLVPNDKLGRVQGALMTLAMGLSPIGAILGGVLVDSIKPWILPMACGVIMIILTIFMARVKELKAI